MVADERYFMIYYIVYRYLCSSKIETITLTIMNKSSKLSIIPVMLCFFAMGFVDLVGIEIEFSGDTIFFQYLAPRGEAYGKKMKTELKRIDKE